MQRRYLEDEEKERKFQHVKMLRSANEVGRETQCYSVSTKDLPVELRYYRTAE